MKLTIYTTSFAENADVIEKLKDFMLASNKYGDFFVCTGVMDVGLAHYATMGSFYLKFFDGDIVFLNIEDYTEYQDKIIGRPILYLSETNETTAKYNLKKYRIITKSNNNQMIWVNNYEV